MMGVRRSISGGRLQRYVAIAPSSDHPASGSRAEWGSWLRLIERKRRMLARFGTLRRRPLPAGFVAQATYTSFRLDGLDVTERQIIDALSTGPARRQLRSRSGQRIRNHVAILHAIEKSFRVNETLKPAAVVRWYTSISCGLSTNELNDNAMSRLDAVVRQINAPQPRLQSTLRDIAKLHTALLNDPLVPSFNGILCRLLLHYHLGRNALPPVLFDLPQDTPRVTEESSLLPRLMELIDEMYLVMIEYAAANEKA